MGFFPILIFLGAVMFLWIMVVYYNLKEKKRKIQSLNANLQVKINENNIIIEDLHQQLKKYMSDSEWKELQNLFGIIGSLPIESKDRHEAERILREKISWNLSVFRLEKKEVDEIEERAEEIRKLRMMYKSAILDYENTKKSPSTKIPSKLLGLK